MASQAIRVENLTLTGSAISADGNSGDNLLVGNGLDNTSLEAEVILQVACKYRRLPNSSLEKAQGWHLNATFSAV